jgi:hypothetical protein
LAKRYQDGLQNPVQILIDLVVPKSHDPIALGGKIRVPLLVVLAFCMLTAVEFYDQPALATDEVDDIRPDRLLTNELMSGELAVVEPVPKFSFNIRLCPTEISRTPDRS